MEKCVFMRRAPGAARSIQLLLGRNQLSGEIYEGHKHELVTLATALLVDKAEAEDVVHDVFVGGIERTGRSRLGPLALVPCWFRYQGGIVREVWMVVQFRESAQGTSCVVYGPHGYALNLKE